MNFFVFFLAVVFFLKKKLQYLMSRIATINCVYVCWHYSWPYLAPEAISGKVATSNYFLFFNRDSKVDQFFNLIFQSILKMSFMYLMSTSYDISDIVGFEKKVWLSYLMWEKMAANIWTIEERSWGNELKLFTYCMEFST